MSSNPWGGQPTAWGGISPATISSLSSWGTTQTHPALPKLSYTPTTIPLSFGSPAQTAVQVGSPSWELGSRSTSSHTVFSPYVVSGSVVSKSSRRRSTLLLSFVQTFVDFPGIASVGPASPSPISINPCLQLNSPNRLAVDFSVSPSEMASHPSTGASAFSPNMTYTRIIINGPTTWFLELPHSHYPLTVASVLSQIYYFLQQVESPNDALSSRMKSDVSDNVYAGTYRDQNFQRGGYGTGVRRIDLLGSRCCLKGFEQATEQNTWILHFRSK